MLREMKLEQTLWLLCAFAVVGFLPAIGFYYVGEEAVFPISSLEMHRAGSWLVQFMYGANVKHNPLFNWLIILFSDVFGWNHVLAVTRAIAIFSTFGSALVLYWLARRLSGDRRFSAFSALLYLTLSDVSLYHGWLAYVDPLFSFFVLASVALLWISAREERIGLLVLAILCLELAFLSKAMTAYVFYGVSALVLLTRHRRFLLSPPALILNILALFFPLFWFSLLPSSGQGQRMFGEILSKLSSGGAGYVRELFAFPFELLVRLMPIAPVSLYFLARKRAMDLPDEFRIAALIGFFNFLPYWLSPQSGIRYLLPLYPFFALFFSHAIWNSGKGALKFSLWLIGAFLVFRMAFMLFLFPWYQENYRGKNYYDTAQEMNRIAQGHPLYTSDVSSSGMSVTGYLDVLRLPDPPLVFPPEKWENGFVISYAENPALGKTYREFRLGGDRIYLLCRGDACGR